jgi:hypothetical protein
VVVAIVDIQCGTSVEVGRCVDGHTLVGTSFKGSSSSETPIGFRFRDLMTFQNFALRKARVQDRRLTDLNSVVSHAKTDFDVSCSAGLEKILRGFFLEKCEIT